MFSTKAKAAVYCISTCSVGIGFIFGRKSYDSNNDYKPKSKYFSYDSTTYVFPTALAKSYSSPKTADYLPATQRPNSKTPDLGIGDDKATTGVNVAETVKYGFPSLDNVRSYEDFILSYDKRTRNANWVLEHLTPDKVDKASVDRSDMKFTEDPSFHSYHRATNKDFQGSGYDRGHLAAAANHRQSRSAMSQTFILSNVAPQVGEGFNRDAWNNLEKYTRAIARKSKNVYVCTGPLYLPRMEPDGKLYIKYEVIGNNHVAVPTHFFKVLLIENDKDEKELLSFVMPNRRLPETKLKNYLVPVDTIERASGLHFFEKIPKSSYTRINAVKIETHAP